MSLFAFLLIAGVVLLLLGLFAVKVLFWFGVALLAVVALVALFGHFGGSRTGRRWF